LAGIRTAQKFNVSWVEFDVALTKDSVPILMHDEDVKRTTDGSGSVSDLTVEEIRKLDAGVKFSPAFKGEKVPTLREALELLIKLDMQANVEIKPATGKDKETALVTCKEIEEVWPKSRKPLLVSSFSKESLETARDSYPNQQRGLLLEKIPEDWEKLFDDLKCATLHCHWSGLTRKALARAKERGIPVLCYTVNSRLISNYLSWRGVSSVFTDYPDKLSR